MFEDQTQISELTEAIEKLNKHHGLWRSFWRGVVSALGATVGVAIVFGLLGFLLQQLSVFPALQDEVRSLLTNVSQINQRAIPLPGSPQYSLPDIKDEEKVEATGRND
jgi:anti-sigma-K factor RskA